MKKLVAKIVECRLHKINWFDTKKDVQMEHFVVLKVPISQYKGRLISTLTLQKSITHPNQKQFITVNFVIKILLVSFFAITQTEVAQRTKCTGDQERGCYTISRKE